MGEELVRGEGVGSILLTARQYFEERTSWRALKLSRYLTGIAGSLMTASQLIVPTPVLPCLGRTFGTISLGS
jgi:hypothetical protein